MESVTCFPLAPLVLLPVRDTCCKKTTARLDCEDLNEYNSISTHLNVFKHPAIVKQESTGCSRKNVELKFAALLNILGVGIRNVPSKTLDEDCEVPAEGISLENPYSVLPCKERIPRQDPQHLVTAVWKLIQCSWD